jgi:hypothetical protein
MESRLGHGGEVVSQTLLSRNVFLYTSTLEAESNKGRNVAKRTGKLKYMQ